MDAVTKVAAVAALYKAYQYAFEKQKKSVNGKSILVTGAASGVGRSLAVELAKRGAKRLILWDIQEENLNETKSLVTDENPSIQIDLVVCNLGDGEAVKETIQRLGEIDILINNAGVISGKYFDVDDKYELVMKVNVLAHMHMVQALLPQMIERGGHIATVSSVAGLIGASQMVSYSASKFAAVGFLEALNLELYERGINNVKVSCICPTLINTGLFKGFYIPMNPTLETIEVVNAVIDAIEFERELVVVPSWLKLSTVILKSFISLDGGLGIKMPIKSPLKDFDRSQADQAFKAIEKHSSSRL